jgi:hypothetical protein
MSAAATAEPFLARGVSVECAPVKVVRLIASDEQKLGRNYASLTSAELNAAKSIASDIFASPTSKVATVPAAFWGERDANGDQWKKEGDWPGDALRARTGHCSTTEPQTLGRKGSTAYALISVSCPSGSAPWNDIRLGVQMVDGKVASYCANVGSFASVVIPREGQR